MKEEKRSTALSDEELGEVNGGKVFNPRFKTADTAVETVQSTATEEVITGLPTAVLIQPDITVATGRPAPTLNQ